MNIQRFLLFSVCSLSISAFAMADSTAVSSGTFKAKGSFRVRPESANFTDYQFARSGVPMRMRGDLTWEPSSDVTVFAQPQFSKTWGEAGYSGVSSTVNARQDTSGDVFDPALRLHQGYVKWKLCDEFSLQVGRQVLSYGDELVIGGLDWNNVGRSFDGAVLKMAWGSSKTDFFWSKIQENNPTLAGLTYKSSTQAGITGNTATVNGDKDLLGIYQSFDFGSLLKNVDFYVLSLLDSTTAVRGDIYTAGTRVKSSVDALDYRVEANYQRVPYIVDQKAYQADAEVGYTLKSAWEPRLSLEAFHASRDYNQMYPTSHKWLGFADVLGRRNVYGGVVHLSAKPAEKTGLMVDYHQFYRTDLGASAYKVNGTALGVAGGSKSKHIGHELDLTVTQGVSQQVSLAFGYSLFFAGSYIKDQAVLGNRTPQFGYAQMVVQF